MDGLEEKLIQDKWLSQGQLNQAVREAKKIGKSVWACLVKMGILTQEDISVFFAQESGIPYVRISDYQLSEEVIGLVDEDFCRENLILPLFRIKDRLFAAFVNPLDTTAIDALAAKTGCEIEPLIANIQSIKQAQDYYYGPEERIFDFRRLIMKQRSTHSLPFYRNSQRVSFILPVLLCVDDKNFILRYSSPVEGITRDITTNAQAIGLQVFLFIPRGTALSLEFKSGKQAFSKETIKVKGEVIHCRMEKGLRYFLGVKFTQMDEAARSDLLKFIEQKKLDNSRNQ
ncbi:PilZ domain-containing protein [Candidatus Omnitrophota bacterium]